MNVGVGTHCETGGKGAGGNKPRFTAQDLKHTKEGRRKKGNKEVSAIEMYRRESNSILHVFRIGGAGTMKAKGTNRFAVFFPGCMDDFGGGHGEKKLYNRLFRKDGQGEGGAQLGGRKIKHVTAYLTTMCYPKRGGRVLFSQGPQVHSSKKGKALGPSSKGEKLGRTGGKKPNLRGILKKINFRRDVEQLKAKKQECPVQLGLYKNREGWWVNAKTAQKGEEVARGLIQITQKGVLRLRPGGRSKAMSVFSDN